MRTIDAEQYLICSLEVRQHGGSKSDKKMRNQLVNVDNKRVATVFHRIPTEYYTSIGKAVRSGRAALANNGLVWTSKKPGVSGKSASLDGYLVHVEDFHTLDTAMTKARNQFWAAADKNIFQNYDYIRRNGMVAYHESTGIMMSDEQMDKFYPDISIVKEAFAFTFKPLPLYGFQDSSNKGREGRVWHPSWSDERRDVFDKVKHAAIEDQNRRITNGMESLVGRALDVAKTQAANISQYKKEDGDEATGLPYANTWEIMEGLADELDKWGARVSNDNGKMKNLASKIHDMIDGISDATSGDLGSLRGMMSQDASPIREEIGTQLKDIEKSASSALEDLLS